MSRTWRARLRAWATSTIPLENTDDAETGRKILSADLWSLGIGAAVAGYFSADYLAFYPPVDRAAFGLTALTFIVMTHKGLSTRTQWKRAAWLAPILVVLAASLATAGDYIAPHLDAANAAEVRCAHIQHEMLMPHPRRADLPNIFEALGCHASGREDIAFPEAGVRQLPAPSVRTLRRDVARPHE